MPAWLRRGFARRAATLGLAALLVVASPVAPSLAQSPDDQQGTSYLTPFPEGERYKLRVIGDEYGEGIHHALIEAFSSEPRLDIEKKHTAISGLTRPDSDAEIKSVIQAAVRERPHVAVVMLGSADRWSYRTSDGKRHAVGTPEWRKVYAQRADEVIRGLKSAGVGIYWIGLPIMRKWETNEAAQAQNQVFRERAYLNGIRFIDVFASFADEQGEYNAYGPDVAGKSRLLRDADGMHMTDAGYQKLAHFLERELKRDLNQAKNERAIPLAGSEAEQALVNPARLAAKPQAGSGSWLSVATRQPDGAGAQGGQAADTSRINLKTVGSDGREQVVPIEIVRPAIPAAVIALVTRRESAEKASAMGDQVVDQIPGGLTVMSSITPGADSTSGGLSRRKLSPAQTPYFRVLVKGERIVARPGRADDTSWPRPEPEPEPRPAKKSDADGGDAAAVEGSVVPSSAVPLPSAKPRR